MGPQLHKKAPLSLIFLFSLLSLLTNISILQNFDKKATEPLAQVPNDRNFNSLQPSGFQFVPPPQSTMTVGRNQMMGWTFGLASLVGNQIAFIVTGISTVVRVWDGDADGAKGTAVASLLTGMSGTTAAAVIISQAIKKSKKQIGQQPKA